MKRICLLFVHNFWVACNLKVALRKSRAASRPNNLSFWALLLTIWGTAKLIIIFIYFPFTNLKFSVSQLERLTVKLWKCQQRIRSGTNGDFGFIDHEIHSTTFFGCGQYDLEIPS